MNDRQLGYIKKILFKNLIKFLGFLIAKFGLNSLWMIANWATSKKYYLKI
jgi:hypothetical protein